MGWKSIHFAAFVGAPAFIALLANTHTSDLKVKTLGGETFFTAAAAKMRKNCAELPVENQKLRTVRGRNPHTPTSPGGKNEKNVLLHRVREIFSKSVAFYFLFFYTSVCERAGRKHSEPGHRSLSTSGASYWCERQWWAEFNKSHVHSQSFRSREKPKVCLPPASFLPEGS